MFSIFTFGPLRVILDADTGEVLAVQDALTQCAAALMYSRKSIADAATSARLAWASITEPV